MRVPTFSRTQIAASAPSWAGVRGAAATFGWQRAAISLVVLLTTSFVGLKAYERVRPAAAPAVPLQTASIAKRSIVERVSLPGTAASGRQAKLSFSASGAGVSVSGVVKGISVKTGDVLKAGQEVARLDTTSLDLAVKSAQSSLAVAQLKMQTLLAGALPPDAAASEQSVISATSTYQKAQNDLSTLTSGASAGDLATATQAALTAQNTLTTAQSALDVLQARATAASQSQSFQASIDQMNAQQTSARASIATTLDQVQQSRGFAAGDKSALGSLESAIRARCSLVGNGEACLTAAQSATDLAGLVQAIDAKTPSIGSDLSQVLASFNNTFSGDASAFGSAPFQLMQSLAELPGLNTRQNNAVLSISGSAGVPSADVLTSAVRTRDAAAAAAQAAQAKVNALVQGPTGNDLQAAQNTLANAKAGLDSVRLKRDQLLGGPLSSDIALQEQTLVQAQISLQRSQNDQAGAILLAPFDGVVGAITMNVGEPSGSGAIILLDPTQMQLNATAQESDVAKLKLGQTVALTFDAYQGATANGRVASIAPAADVVQGVPSYAIVIAVTQAAARGGQGNIDLRSGMAGTAAIEIQRHDNVVAVPARAVKRVGRNSVVQVLGADGKQETRTITTGASDGTYSEVLTGLKDGEVVVIAAATTTTTAGATAAAGGAGAGATGFGGAGGGFAIQGGPAGR